LRFGRHRSPSDNVFGIAVVKIASLLCEYLCLLEKIGGGPIEYSDAAASIGVTAATIKIFGKSRVQLSLCHKRYLNAGVRSFFGAAARWRSDPNSIHVVGMFN
jgi:hypothetical protein